MRRGLPINAFAPRIFATPVKVESELATVGRTEAGFTDELVAGGTTVRLGTVDEMAAMILFLCSPAARYVCGATLVADGASMQTNWVSFFPEGAMEQAPARAPWWPGWCEPARPRQRTSRRRTRCPPSAGRRSR